jgi:2-polyprenyl-3-methyl-5-hydroxy-6-metoxy-1,4-benzoquinol methylase
VENVITLHHPQGTVTIEEIAGGKRRIQTHNTLLFTPISSCETSYPVDLISLILRSKGPSYLCEEIARDEDRYYIESGLILSILAYISEDKFLNKRLLDFGCGSGASTMILSRKFQRTEIVGVDLVRDFIRIAQARARYYKVENRVKFFVSQDSTMLPKGIGNFDFIVLNAVYEHLLPNERRKLSQQLWKILEPGGMIFCNETPYRFSPIEFHTTGGLPLINYLPDRMAFAIARRYSRKFALRDESGNNLLRRGIRGATEHEILTAIRESGGKPLLLSPTRFGCKDRIDLRFVPVKTGARISGNRLVHGIYRSRLLRYALKFVLKTTGISFLDSITLAIQKEI